MSGQPIPFCLCTRCQAPLSVVEVQCYATMCQDCELEVDLEAKRPALYAALRLTSDGRA